ncbi:MAG: ribbon-helix-helix domain-containing protein [Alphaproteobacteria bacterium]|nr:ribbon-helix-helix domain-containing protein [Alphaproteobacteria bacterium]
MDNDLSSNSDGDVDNKICQAGRSSLVSRNITIFGRRTSIRLEPEMWVALNDIAGREKCSVHDVCSLVYVRKNSLTSLTAAIRVFLMLYYRAAATDTGHKEAGHGDFSIMKQRARISDKSFFEKSPARQMRKTATAA